jgi:hypothetical protein
VSSNPVAIDTKFLRNFNGSAAQPAASAVNWRDILSIHPAADRIPDASEDEKHAIAADLARQGQRQPVILVHVATRLNAPPQLLDGRTRLDLLSAAGVEVVDAKGKVLVHHRIIQVENDAEAEALSLGLNVHRRHLTAEQKRELIVQQLKATPEKSNRRIADSVKADHKTVASVRANQLGKFPS